MKSILNGEWWPLAPQFVMPVVDVADVAAALLATLYTDRALGRHVMVFMSSQTGCNLSDIECPTAGTSQLVAI